MREDVSYEMTPHWLRPCSAIDRKPAVDISYYNWSRVEWWQTAFTPYDLTQLRANGACPTHGILIDFEIGSKFGVPWFKMGSTDHILHTSRQVYYRDVGKFRCVRLNMLWTRALQNFTEFEFDRNFISGTGTPGSAGSLVSRFRQRSTTNANQVSCQ